MVSALSKNTKISVSCVTKRVRDACLPKSYYQILKKDWFPKITNSTPEPLTRHFFATFNTRCALAETACDDVVRIIAQGTHENFYPIGLFTKFYLNFALNESKALNWRYFRLWSRYYLVNYKCFLPTLRFKTYRLRSRTLEQKRAIRRMLPSITHFEREEDMSL